MANSLHTINEHFVEGNRFGEERDSPDLRAAIGSLDAPYLCWMFEHFVTPIKTKGIGKVNVLLTAATPNPPPEEVLGIAYVFEHFDIHHYESLVGRDRARYHLDRLHAAVGRCARHFGWDTQSIDAARRQILAADFRFAFAWKKPIASPNRRLKVHVAVEVTGATRLLLVFMDRELGELRRVLLTQIGFGRGTLEYVLGRVAWQDATTVRVEHDNGRDFWLCQADGTPEFHYPPAESGSPQGVFALGRMYFEGTYVLQDQPRGLALMKTAAASGDRHAQNYLRRVNQSSGS